MFDDVLRPVGLTNGQFSLLISLNRPEAPRMNDVASLLAMDRTTLTANLKPLQKRGLILVEVDQKDRRGRRLVLTDAGRDVLTQIMYGGRISLAVGFVATAVALLIGVTWGAVAGYVGGSVDAVMMRLVDILYALPFMIFIVLLMVVFGRNILLLFLAIGAVEWLTMARIMRSQVQSLRQQEFVEAAVSVGLSPAAIIRKHVVPNALGPIIVYTTLTIPSVMLLEAFLSFLGLGIQPPATSWGLLISYGAETMEEYPWLLIFPGCALTLTLFSLNFLGDGLRDALDVRGSKD